MAELVISMIQKYSWVLVVIILLFGWFSPLLMILTFTCMFAPIIFSFKYGRAWCGNFCPRNSFNNSVLGYISPNKKMPGYLRTGPFRLIVFVSLIGLFIYNIAHSNGTLIGVGYAFIKMMALTTLIQVCMAVYIHKNAWCAVCPMGAASSLITKLKGNVNDNVVFTGNCISCGSCNKVCPMQIDVQGCSLKGKVTDSDCMKCRKCISACPQKTLSWGS